jgi:hypothetical protein
VAAPPHTAKAAVSAFGELEHKFQLQGEALMHPVLIKTFGGLSREYYFRNFIFGLIFPAILLLMIRQAAHSELTHTLSLILIMTINSLLYPYSRFVYEGVMRFILGNNVFFVNGIFFLLTKAFTMLLCWSMAIFIAPIGLAYLYYHHSRQVPQEPALTPRKLKAPPKGYFRSAAYNMRYGSRAPYLWN